MTIGTYIQQDERAKVISQQQRSKDGNEGAGLTAEIELELGAGACGSSGRELWFLVPEPEDDHRGATQMGYYWVSLPTYTTFSSTDWRSGG